MIDSTKEYIAAYENVPLERALMTPDELKSMPKGQLIVMKTGFYPMIVKLKLFFKWGIKFGEEYPVPRKSTALSLRICTVKKFA